MTQPKMTSLERVLTALSHHEPDRVPLFLPLTMHGAREMGLSIRDYYSTAENIAQGQLRMLRKYGADFVYNFTYAAAESEAFGAEALFFDDGPPNAGMPVISTYADIDRLETPRVADVPSLVRVLRATELLYEAVGGTVPIVGVVMSPFSLPVMQMGFSRYFELLYENPPGFERLMRINEEFCVEWANAQIDAGATAIGYFDPVASPTIIPQDLYQRTGRNVDRRTLARIKGPTAGLLASGRTIPILDEMVSSGVAIVGSSSDEDLAEVKAACAGRVTLMGNLNGIEMRRWTQLEAETAVKTAIAAAGRGGGYILTDTHGEIPWQVPEDVLAAIAEAVREWGRYPLDWIEQTQ